MALFRKKFAAESPEAEALKLTGTQSWFWIAYAVGCYQTILLQDNGFSASVIGLINALMSAVAIVGNLINSRLFFSLISKEFSS